jgi:hypothetical protein
MGAMTSANQPATTVHIDKAVRVNDALSMVWLSDCHGPVEPGDVVRVVDLDTGAYGGAQVYWVNEKHHVVYLSVGELTLPR